MPANLAVLASATVIFVHGAFADGSSWNNVIATICKRNPSMSFRCKTRSRH